MRIYEKKELASPFGVCDQEERGSSPGGCVSLHCEREELIRRYAKKDENGEIMTEDDCYIMEDKERFGKDMSEL